MASGFYRTDYLVTIGRLQTRTIHEIEITSSWKELTSTATIQLPRNLKLKDKAIRDYIKRGDKVEIKAGYNGALVTEFTGYVREVEAEVPLVISCEDEMFKLKSKAITKSWKAVSLKELVAFIAPGYKAIVADVQLGKFQIQNASAAKVLEELKEQYRLYAYFRDQVLHVGFPYEWTYTRHIYDYQRNVRDSGLKFHGAEEFKVRVKAIANLPNGKKLIEHLGDEDGELRTLNFGNISQAELKKQAQAELKLFKFDGYRGDITGWGLPVTRHGDLATIRNKKYPEREGTYFIDKVTFTGGQDGMKRTNELGARSR